MKGFESIPESSSVERIQKILEQSDSIQEDEGWLGDLESAKTGFKKAFGKQKDGVDEFNWQIVAGFDPRLRADRDFMMAMVKKGQFVQGDMISRGWGMVLRYASPELKADRDFAITAINNCNERGWAYDNTEPVYSYISPELQQDNEIIILSATKHSKTWDYVPKEKLSDDSFLQLCFKKGLMSVLKYAPEQYRNDIKLVKKALEKFLVYESDTDKDFLDFPKEIGISESVMEELGDYIFEKYGLIMYCTQTQKDSEDFVKKAIQRNFKNARYCSKRLADDKDFLLDALCRSRADGYDIIKIMKELRHKVEDNQISEVRNRIRAERNNQ